MGNLIEVTSSRVQVSEETLAQAKADLEDARAQLRAGEGPDLKGSHHTTRRWVNKPLTVSTPYVEEPLEISVIYYDFATAGKRGAWHDGFRQLTLWDVHDPAVWGTYRHELVHVVQTMIQEARRLPGPAGAPPGRRYAPEYEDSKPHAERDVEFYSNLESMIQAYEDHAAQMRSVGIDVSPRQFIETRQVFDDPRFSLSDPKKQRKFLTEFLRHTRHMNKTSWLEVTADGAPIVVRHALPHDQVQLPQIQIRRTNMQQMSGRQKGGDPDFLRQVVPKIQDLLSQWGALLYAPTDERRARIYSRLLQRAGVPVTPLSYKDKRGNQWHLMGDPKTPIDTYGVQIPADDAAAVVAGDKSILKRNPELQDKLRELYPNLYSDSKWGARAAMPMQVPSPDAVHVFVYPTAGGYQVRVVDITENRTLADVTAYPYYTYMGHSDVWTVRNAKAERGYGPLAYDILLELAAQNGAWVTSDARSVTDDATAVWRKYEQRSDVDKEPVPDGFPRSREGTGTNYMFRKSAPEFTERYRVTAEAGLPIDVQVRPVAEGQLAWIGLARRGTRTNSGRDPERANSDFGRRILPLFRQLASKYKGLLFTAGDARRERIYVRALQRAGFQVTKFDVADMPGSLYLVGDPNTEMMSYGELTTVGQRVQGMADRPFWRMQIPHPSEFDRYEAAVNVVDEAPEAHDDVFFDSKQPGLLDTQDTAFPTVMDNNSPHGADPAAPERRREGFIELRAYGNELGDLTDERDNHAEAPDLQIDDAARWSDSYSSENQFEDPNLKLGWVTVQAAYAPPDVERLKSEIRWMNQQLEKPSDLAVIENLDSMSDDNLRSLWKTYYDQLSQTEGHAEMARVTVHSNKVVETHTMDAAYCLYGEGSDDIRTPWCGNEDRGLYEQYGGRGLRRFLVLPNGPDKYVDLDGQRVPVAADAFTFAVNAQGKAENVNDYKNRYLGRGLDVEAGQQAAQTLDETMGFSTFQFFGPEGGDWSAFEGDPEAWQDNGFGVAAATTWRDALSRTMLYDWVAQSDPEDAGWSRTESLFAQDAAKWKDKTNGDWRLASQWADNYVMPSDAEDFIKKGVSPQQFEKYVAHDQRMFTDGRYDSTLRYTPDIIMTAMRYRVPVDVLGVLDPDDISHDDLRNAGKLEAAGYPVDEDTLEFVRDDPKRRINWLATHPDSEEEDFIRDEWDLRKGDNPVKIIKLVRQIFDGELEVPEGISEFSTRALADILRAKNQSEDPNLKLGRVTVEARVYHGSDRAFAAPDHDLSGLGTHLGTWEAAVQRVYDKTDGEGEDLYVYEYAFDPRKLLRLEDHNIGDWGAERLYNELASVGLVDDTTETPSFEFLRSQLTERGYDGIVYINDAEGTSGTDSYIVWNDKARLVERHDLSLPAPGTPEARELVFRHQQHTPEQPLWNPAQEDDPFHLVGAPRDDPDMLDTDTSWLYDDDDDDDYFAPAEESPFDEDEYDDEEYDDEEVMWDVESLSAGGSLDDLEEIYRLEYITSMLQRERRKGPLADRAERELILGEQRLNKLVLQELRAMQGAYQNYLAHMKPLTEALDPDDPEEADDHREGMKAIQRVESVLEQLRNSEQPPLVLLHLALTTAHQHGQMAEHIYGKDSDVVQALDRLSEGDPAWDAEVQHLLRLPRGAALQERAGVRVTTYKDDAGRVKGLQCKVASDADHYDPSAEVIAAALADDFDIYSILGAAVDLARGLDPGHESDSWDWLLLEAAENAALRKEYALVPPNLRAIMEPYSASVVRAYEQTKREEWEASFDAAAVERSREIERQMDAIEAEQKRLLDTPGAEEAWRANQDQLIALEEELMTHEDDVDASAAGFEGSYLYDDLQDLQKAHAKMMAVPYNAKALRKLTGGLSDDDLEALRVEGVPLSTTAQMAAALRYAEQAKTGRSVLRRFQSRFEYAEELDQEETPYLLRLLNYGDVYDFLDNYWRAPGPGDVEILNPFPRVRDALAEGLWIEARKAVKEAERALADARSEWESGDDWRPEEDEDYLSALQRAADVALWAAALGSEHAAAWLSDNQAAVKPSVHDEDDDDDLARTAQTGAWYHGSHVTSLEEHGFQGHAGNHGGAVFLTPDLSFAKLHAVGQGGAVFRAQLAPGLRIFEGSDLLLPSDSRFGTRSGFWPPEFEDLTPLGMQVWEMWERNSPGGDPAEGIKAGVLEHYDNIEFPPMRQLLRAAGYDGAYVTGDGPRNLMVFDPRNVQLSRIDRTAQTQRPPTVCVDLDGTLLQDVNYDAPTEPSGQPALSDPNEGAKGAMGSLNDLGWRVIVHTARFSFGRSPEQIEQMKDEIDTHLRGHDIHFDEIATGPKPVADVYVDDRAKKFDGDWWRVVKEVTTGSETDDAPTPEVRTAAVIQAPPAMVAVGEEILRKYLARMTLHAVRANAKKEKTLARQLPALIEKAEEQLDSVRSIAEGLQEHKSARLPALPLKPDAPPAHYEVTRVARDAWTLLLQNPKASIPLGEVNDAAELEYVLTQMIKTDISKARTLIKNVEKGKGDDIKFAEWLKPMSRARAGDLALSDRVSTTLPVDFEDWKYANEFANIQLPLRLRFDIHASAQRVGDEEAAGSYNFDSDNLMVAFDRTPSNKEEFASVLRSAVTTLEHELVHMFQAMLQRAKDLRNPPGLARKVRDDLWEVDRDRAHPTREVEFYPNLISETRAFMQANDEGVHVYSPQAWVTRPGNTRWNQLKEHNEQAWRKMVREFVKEVERLNSQRLAFSARDAWIDPDGRWHKLGSDKTHNTWVLRRMTELGISKEEAQAGAKTALMNKGWIRVMWPDAVEATVAGETELERAARMLAGKSKALQVYIEKGGGLWTWARGQGFKRKALTAKDAWVDPEGNWHQLGAEITHAAWAANYLGGNWMPLATASSKLIDDGWVRVSWPDAVSALRRTARQIEPYVLKLMTQSRAKEVYVSASDGTYRFTLEDGFQRLDAPGRYKRPSERSWWERKFGAGTELDLEGDPNDWTDADELRDDLSVDPHGGSDQLLTFTAAGPSTLNKVIKRFILPHTRDEARKEQEAAIRDMATWDPTGTKYKYLEWIVLSMIHEVEDDGGSYSWFADPMWYGRYERPLKQQLAIYETAKTRGWIGPKAKNRWGQAVSTNINDLDGVGDLSVAISHIKNIPEYKHKRMQDKGAKKLKHINTKRALKRFSQLGLPAYGEWAALTLLNYFVQQEKESGEVTPERINALTDKAAGIIGEVTEIHSIYKNKLDMRLESAEPAIYQMVDGSTRDLDPVDLLDQLALVRDKIRQYQEPAKYEVLLDDERGHVIRLDNHKASKELCGTDTEWCTAYESPHFFSTYTKDGSKLYVVRPPGTKKRYLATIEPSGKIGDINDDDDQEASAKEREMVQVVLNAAFGGGSDSEQSEKTEEQLVAEYERYGQNYYLWLTDWPKLSGQEGLPDISVVRNWANHGFSDIMAMHWAVTGVHPEIAKHYYDANVGPDTYQKYEQQYPAGIAAINDYLSGRRGKRGLDWGGFADQGETVAWLNDNPRQPKEVMERLLLHRTSDSEPLSNALRSLRRFLEAGRRTAAPAMDFKPDETGRYRPTPIGSDVKYPDGPFYEDDAATVPSMPPFGFKAPPRAKLQNGTLRLTPKNTWEFNDVLFFTFEDEPYAFDKAPESREIRSWWDPGSEWLAWKRSTMGKRMSMTWSEFDKFRNSVEVPPERVMELMQEARPNIVEKMKERVERDLRADHKQPPGGTLPEDQWLQSIAVAEGHASFQDMIEVETAGVVNEDLYDKISGMVQRASEKGYELNSRIVGDADLSMSASDIEAHSWPPEVRRIDVQVPGFEQLSVSFDSGRVAGRARKGVDKQLSGLTARGHV